MAVETELDPRAAAARAMGDSPDTGDTGGSEPDSEGSNPTPDADSSTSAGSGSGGSPLRSFISGLLDADADGPSLSDLRSDYQLNRPGALMLRGVLRASGAGGMPPIGEISLGGILWGREQTTSSTTSSSDDDQEESAGELGAASV